jgi:hypothetical protein
MLKLDLVSVCVIMARLTREVQPEESDRVGELSV